VTKRLYVGNLGYATTENKLSQFFGEIGEVISVNLITDHMTGRSRGFAFIDMAKESDAQRAIKELNGKELDEQKIKVAKARPK